MKCSVVEDEVAQYSTSKVKKYLKIMLKHNIWETAFSHALTTKSNSNTWPYGHNLWLRM